MMLDDYKERDMEPPEPSEDYEEDFDSINDEIWLLKKEKEENEHWKINTKIKCTWKNT